MSKFCWSIVFALFPVALLAQDARESENGCVVETKIGVELDWHFGKKGQYVLAPSFRSVHNNRRVGSSWNGYRGMAAELNFSMPLWKYFRFFTDLELDLNKNSDSHLTFGTGVNAACTKGRFSINGELRYSTDRNLHYIDRDRNPHLKYKFGGGFYLVEKIWKFTLQATLPHSLKENAISGLSLEGVSAFTIGKHFGLNFSFEWSNTFATGQDGFSPQISAVFTI